MKIIKQIAVWSFTTIFFVSSGVYLTNSFINFGAQADTLRLDDQEATIRAINQAAPGVVSINIFNNSEVRVMDPVTGLPKVENKKIKLGAGSGFLISSDGLILTNKHVANAATGTNVEYKVILNSGKQYYAQLIGLDPVQDLAILKIFDKNLPYLQMGDSNNLKVGSTVIAIGNALGRYSNSATKGIISGLGRSLMASGQNGQMESLENVIQTDAQINLGNSGGPLIDLSGKVVGVNVAKDEGGESLGFSIPINEAKPVIESARKVGKIIRPRLGVRYLTITPEIFEERKLSRSTGALLFVNDKGEPAVVPGSPADKAGLQAGDIIFEIDGKKIDERMPLLSYISQFGPGKKLGFKIQRGNNILTKIITLDEF